MSVKYELKTLPDSFNEWKKFFADLPKDPYVKEGFRYKKIGWFKLKAGENGCVRVWLFLCLFPLFRHIQWYSTRKC